jgi:hypothetical protein
MTTIWPGASRASGGRFASFGRRTRSWARHRPVLQSRRRRPAAPSPQLPRSGDLGRAAPRIPSLAPLKAEIACTDQHREVNRGESICPLAPPPGSAGPVPAGDRIEGLLAVARPVDEPRSRCHAARLSKVPARGERDAGLGDESRRVWEEDCRVYGLRKGRRQLRCDGIELPGRPVWLPGRAARSGRATGAGDSCSRPRSRRGGPHDAAPQGGPAGVRGRDGAARRARHRRLPSDVAGSMARGRIVASCSWSSRPDRAGRAATQRDRHGHRPDRSERRRRPRRHRPTGRAPIAVVERLRRRLAAPGRNIADAQQ